MACVGYGWSGGRYAKSALRQTLERITMTVEDAPGPEFPKTLVDGDVLTARRPGRLERGLRPTTKLATVCREDWSAAPAHRRGS